MTSSNELWRVRARWSREGTCIVNAPTEELARQTVQQHQQAGTLNLDDAEKTHEYFHTFKIHPATPKKGLYRKPIDPETPVLVYEPALKPQRISDARMALRQR